LRVPITNVERAGGWEGAEVQQNWVIQKQGKVEVRFGEAAGQQLWQAVVVMARAVAERRGPGRRRTRAFQQMEECIQRTPEEGKVRKAKRLVVVNEQTVQMALAFSGNLEHMRAT